MAPKSSLTPPPVTDSDRRDSKGVVRIFHPAYPQTVPLLQLGAFEPGGGIDFDFAWTACCIVTGNTFAIGWLAKKVSGAFDRIARPDDGILRDPAVFFCVGDDANSKYPVVPTFDHWEFPHDKLLAPWNNLHIEPYMPPNTSILTPTDGKMAVAYRDVRSAIAINDLENLILIRRDLHHLLDTRRLFFNAKATSPFNTTPMACLTVQVPGMRSSADLVALYHNRALQPSMRGLSVEFLFARLAWTLFTDAYMPFFTDYQSAYTTLLLDPDDKIYRVHENMSGENVRQRASVFPAFTARSMSPKKRSRGPEEDDGDTEEDDGDTEEDDDDTEEDMPRRGRTMMRTYHIQRDLQPPVGRPAQMPGCKSHFDGPPMKKRQLASPVWPPGSS
ncbi:hypothetical protein GGTG_10410 [Gaeumannomyces tritici R3-111a-1]|uniref:HNH nuclease domain-containing protein n=1 Tax=Gaeumannomyces tritici (strain R3-111a-1) TaxID=644352 RepID=J3PA84_GAET3|nr:hypothetical protein GGTG_10410 [Gaeumannomyces tritici R3-111a-1]EJT71150.1 hypothetical protein GGTG_10410 [Gaeumannomyces tritici R3-111a-1]